MADFVNNNKRIAKNTAFLYIRMLFVLFVSLYTTRAVLKVLGVEDYGVYNVVAGFVSMFAFLNTSLNGAIQRFYNFEHSQNGEEGLKRVYTTSLIIQSVLALIVIILLETIGLWYVNHVMVVSMERIRAANIVFQFSILSLVIVIMQIPYSAAVMSFERMNYYAIVGIIDILLKLLIVIVLPFFNSDKLITYGLLLLIISILNFLFYYIYAKNYIIELRTSKDLDKNLFKKMLAFSGWNFFGTFSNVAYMQGLNMLLNFFFGPVVNAARGIAAQVNSALTGFFSNIVVAFRPQLVNSYAVGNYNRTRTIMFAESKIGYSLILLLSTPIIIEINYILRIWLGEGVPNYTAEFIVLILINTTILTLNIPFSQVVHATGKMRTFQLVTGGITILNIPISYVLLKFGGTPLSVYYIAIILSVLSQAACVFIVRKIFPYSVKYYLTRIVLRCVLLTITLPIAPLLVFFLMEESFIRLVLVCVSTVTLGGVLVYYIVLSVSERVFIKEIINNRFNRHKK